MLIFLIQPWVRNQCGHEHKYECALWITEKAGHGRILAEEALKRGFQCVVAIEGDRTNNEIAKGLLYTQVPLGIIPKGSANGFAREFGIPLDPRKACDALLQSKTLSIDAGRINEELSLAWPILDLMPRLVMHTTDLAKKVGEGKHPIWRWEKSTSIIYPPQ